MAYMRVHCGVCGKVWEVYHRDDWKSDTTRQCPHCFAEIDKSTWEHHILPAFNEANDAENELYRSHTGAKQPLFSIDLIADRVSDEKRAICPIIERNMLDYDIPY